MISPGTVPLRLHTMVSRSFLLEEMHRDLSPHGEVLGCVALPNTAVVLAKGDVEPPVEGVRNAPRLLHTLPHLLGVRTKTADGVAPVIGGRMA